MKLVATAAALVAAVVLADTLWKNQGTTMGPVNVINCSGVGLTCTRDGSTGNIVIGGDGGFGSVPTTCDAGAGYTGFSTHGGVSVPPATCNACMAPCGASYITEVAETGLSNEFPMSSLGTGLVQNTTGTGVPSIYGGSSCGAGNFASALSSAGSLTCSAGVATVTATPPLVSSGGTNPNLSSPCAGAGQSGWLCDSAGELAADASVTVINDFNGTMQFKVDNANNGNNASARISFRGDFDDAGQQYQAGIAHFSSQLSTASSPYFRASTWLFSSSLQGLAFALSNTADRRPDAAFHWFENHGSVQPYYELMKLERTGALRNYIVDGGVARGMISGSQDCLGTGDVACWKYDGTNVQNDKFVGIASGGTNSSSTPTAGALPYGDGSKYVFGSAGTSGYYLTSGGSGAYTWSPRDTKAWSGFFPGGILGSAFVVTTFRPGQDITLTLPYYAQILVVGTGAATFSVDVYDVTSAATLCTISAVACTAAIGAQAATCASSASSGDLLQLRVNDVECATAPVMNLNLEYQ